MSQREKPTDPKPYYNAHVFCCTNRRVAGHPRGSCADRGSEALRDYMKGRARQLGIENVRINNAGCLDRCELGPTVVIYPEGVWYACFAQYAKTGDPAKTKVVTFDAQWKKLSELRFPRPMVLKFGKNSSSGGSFGPQGHLFITGHDAQELYVLDLPALGDVLSWQTAIPISAHGQAFAWDRSQEGVLYSIDRKTHEVIVSRVQR